MTKHDEAPLGARTAPVGGVQAGRAGEHASPTAWVAVFLVVVGLTIGLAALITHLIVLWIIGGVILAVGGILMLTSRVMSMAY